MKKVTLKSGKNYKLKSLTRDELDDMIDCLQFDPETGFHIKPNKMMTSWFRVGLESCDEDVLLSMSMEERTELFGLMQETYVTGEGKASNSK